MKGQTVTGTTQRVHLCSAFRLNICHMNLLSGALLVSVAPMGEKNFKK